MRNVLFCIWTNVLSRLLSKFLVRLQYYYSTDEDPSLRIESSAIINLRGVSTKFNKSLLSVVKKCNATV